VLRIHVYRDLAHGLRRVAVERHAALPADAADLGHRLERAHFVVRVHDRDQHGALPDSRLHRAGVHQPVAAHRQPGDARAALLQTAADVQHRLVFNGAGDYVIALAGARFHHAFDRQVVRFGGAAGENNLLRRRANEAGNPRARFVHGLLRLPPELVIAAGRVAELARKIRQHGIQHARIEGGGGMVVQVNHAADPIIADTQAEALLPHRRVIVWIRSGKGYFKWALLRGRTASQILFRKKQPAAPSPVTTIPSAYNTFLAA